MRYFKSTLLLALICCPAALCSDVRVLAPEVMKFVTLKVQPEYTLMAKQMKVTGRADIEVVIAPDGSVESVKPVSGNPLLTGPAVTAVKKWKFNPVSIDGQAVRAVSTLSFEFK